MRCLELRMSSRLLGRWGSTSLAIAGLVVGLGGCSDVQPVAPADAPITDPTQLYMQLTLEDAAINLSTTPPYHTIQLNAVPRDALGQPMPGLPAPTFQLDNINDSTTIQVTAGGLVTALATTAASGVKVITSLTVGPVTRVDTARIVVKDLPTPPKLASVSIEPIPPDSTIWSYEATGILGLVFHFFLGIVNTQPTPTAVDSTGNPIADLIYEYASLDPTVARFDRWSSQRSIRNPGQVRRVVRTHAYGIARADTVPYTVTLPIAIDVYVDNPGQGSDFRIRPSGQVLWSFASVIPVADTVDIVFDDPTKALEPLSGVCTYLGLVGVVSPCVSGNGTIIGNDFAYGLMVRRFPEPGIYPYRSLRRPEIRGRVVVTTDPFHID